MSASLSLGLWLLLASGIGAHECPDGPDADSDGLSDQCELLLAGQFAPILVVSRSACNWNESAELLEGGYLFGVHPMEGGYRLVFLPAYAMDCGWGGTKCLLRWRGGCDPHVADSEFIVIDLALSGEAGHLQATRVFLSAHCFGTRDVDCRWHDRGALEWWGRQPFVWVAEGKNANYPSEAACDRGHLYFDTCDRNDHSMRFPVLSLVQNIGSWQSPFPHDPDGKGCVGSSRLHLPAGLSGRECVWGDEAFRGWGGPTVQGVTPYLRYLDEVAEMVPQDEDSACTSVMGRCPARRSQAHRSPVPD